MTFLLVGVNAVQFAIGALDRCCGLGLLEMDIKLKLCVTGLSNTGLDVHGLFSNEGYLTRFSHDLPASCSCSGTFRHVDPVDRLSANGEGELRLLAAIGLHLEVWGREWIRFTEHSVNVHLVGNFSIDLGRV